MNYYTTNINGIVYVSQSYSIDPRALARRRDISKVILPKILREIEPGTFQGSSITCIAIPEGVVLVPFRTFSSCDKLRTVKLPNTILDIRTEAFWLSGIVDVYIPDSVQVIGYMAFGDCDSLHTVSLPETVVISPGCFGRSITIPTPLHIYIRINCNRYGYTNSGWVSKYASNCCVEKVEFECININQIEIFDEFVCLMHYLSNTSEILDIMNLLPDIWDYLGEHITEIFEC